MLPGKGPARVSANLGGVILFDAINGDGHKTALGGAESEVCRRLRDNYQVTATASGHDQIVGDDDHLQQALARLPPAP
jgi:hypothetical protein